MSRMPTRKSPRLRFDDDDEVQEVSLPQKVIDLIDLASKNGAAESTVNFGTLPEPVTTTTTKRRRR
jgi:hypothetical protein